MQTRAEVLHGDNYFPEIEPVGHDVCQVFKSSASEGADSARIMYLLSIAAARKRIRIANAYFLPDDLCRQTLIEARQRGIEPGTDEIYVTHRGMEPVPTTKIDNVQGAAFAWAVMPADPDLEAMMLSRLMMSFGTPEAQAVAAAAPSAPVTPHARLEKNDGIARLVVDDPFDRAWRRVGLALDRSGFTVVDRDRSTGTYYVRFSDPDADMARKDREKGFLSKLLNFWKTDDKDKPEQYRIKIVETSPQSTVSVQDPSGNPDRTQASDRILALLRDQLK
jgi:outer membrane protein assembly factor BamC